MTFQSHSHLDALVRRRVTKEVRVLRSAASETVATTAGTLREVSLFLHLNTLGTTPWTGGRHLSTHARTEKPPPKGLAEKHMYLNVLKTNIFITSSCFEQSGFFRLPLTAQSVSWCGLSGQQWRLVFIKLFPLLYIWSHHRSSPSAFGSMWWNTNVKGERWNSF